MTNDRKHTQRACRSIRARLSEAVDGRLGRTDTTEVRQHLLACPSCREQHDQLTQLQNMTRGLRDEGVADDFRERLLARIEAGEGARPEVLQHPSSFAQRAKLFASGAATAAALLISLWLVVDGLHERARSRTDNGGAEIASPVLEPAAPLGMPVSDLRDVDPDRLGFEAVQRSREFFDGLRDQATRVVNHPPKFAMEKLAEKSRALIDSIRFLEVIDGALLELPSELRTKLDTAAAKAEFVLAAAQHEDASRDSVQRVVKQILQELPSLGASARSIKIRLHAPDFDIQRVLVGRTKSTDEMHRVLTYAWTHLAPRALRGNGRATIRFEFEARNGR